MGGQVFPPHLGSLKAIPMVLSKHLIAHPLLELKIKDYCPFYSSF